MSTESNEFEGKNLDVAVWKASQELEIAIEKLRYKILEKGRRGHGDDPGSPARIRILTAEEAEAAVTAAPARQEPSRERPPRRESRPERSRSRREEEQADDEAEEVEEVAEETAADDDRDEAADEIVAEADAGDAEADEATEDEPDVDDEDLDEPPSASSALLEDDDPIEIAREARRRSAQAREERVDEADNGDKAEQPADEEPADDEPAVEARRPRREPRPRRRSARARDERVEETDGGDEPQVEAREPRREPRRERPSRHRESRRPEGALDPDDLESGLEKAREIIPQLLSQMGFDLEMDAEIQEDHIYVPLQGEDCRFLLEHRAEGLNALQFLVNKMAYRGGPTRILVDADGYRKERQEELVERAHAVADEVRDGGNSRSLGSLNPFERRLVHMALRDDEDVRTVSKGEGFLKRMEIVPKHGGDGNESHDSERRPRPRRRRERY